MKKHIQKLKEFIEKNDPSPVLQNLSALDDEIDHEWKYAKEEILGKYKIKSHNDVLYSIDKFEKCVLFSPTDIKLRNKCKHEMLIAQYQAIFGLRTLIERMPSLSIFEDSNFPELSEEEVDCIITRMEEIIKKI